ncbi:MAG: GNAT family N-acetyltransferase [Bacilli bacterium]
MTNITYRYYQSGDEHNIVRLWNDVLRKDPITAKRFRNLILLDGNFDPEGVRLAFDGNKLVGCLYAVRRLLPMYGTDLEPENGWIPFFFVASDYVRQGIGKQLMEDGVTFLNHHERKYVFFASYAPNYILPGIDEEAYPEAYQFLLTQGFAKLYSPVAMNYSLIGFELPSDVKSLIVKRQLEGYEFRAAEDRDLYEVIQFATNVFNPDWGRAIREGVLQGLSLSRIFIARKNGELVGFCLYSGYEGIPERFGPFGVQPDQQGSGLGKILLYTCLHAMRAEGLQGAWFLWTGETSPAGHLYKRVGFDVSRKFHVMKKTM